MEPEGKCHDIAARASCTETMTKKSRRGLTQADLVLCVTVLT